MNSTQTIVLIVGASIALSLALVWLGKRARAQHLLSYEGGFDSMSKKEQLYLTARKPIARYLLPIGSDEEYAEIVLDNEQSSGKTDWSKIQDKVMYEKKHTGIKNATARATAVRAERARRAKNKKEAEYNSLEKRRSSRLQILHDRHNQEEIDRASRNNMAMNQAMRAQAQAQSQSNRMP